MKNFKQHIEKIKNIKVVQKAKALNQEVNKALENEEFRFKRKKKKVSFRRLFFLFNISILVIFVLLFIVGATLHSRFGISYYEANPKDIIKMEAEK